MRFLKSLVIVAVSGGAEASNPSREWTNVLVEWITHARDSPYGAAFYEGEFFVRSERILSQTSGLQPGEWAKAIETLHQKARSERKYLANTFPSILFVKNGYVTGLPTAAYNDNNGALLWGVKVSSPTLGCSYSFVTKNRDFMTRLLALKHFNMGISLDCLGGPEAGDEKNEQITALLDEGGDAYSVKCFLGGTGELLGYYRSTPELGKIQSENATYICSQFAAAKTRYEAAVSQWDHHMHVEFDPLLLVGPKSEAILPPSVKSLRAALLRAKSLAEAIHEWRTLAAIPFGAAIHEPEFDRKLLAVIQSSGPNPTFASVLGNDVPLEDYEKLASELRSLKRTAILNRLLFSTLRHDMSVSVPRGKIEMPHFGGVAYTHHWNAVRAVENCQYQFLTQRGEEAFVASLTSKRHYNMNHEVSCLGSQRAVNERHPDTLAVDGELSKVRISKIFGQPHLILKCYYDRFSLFRSNKIGEYSVPLVSNFADSVITALGLRRQVPSHTQRSAGEAIEYSNETGEYFAYNKEAAGRLCEEFEAAKRFFMNVVVNTPMENRIPNSLHPASNSPEIFAFMDSVPAGDL
jgi:hypothetical protein